MIYSVNTPSKYEKHDNMLWATSYYLYHISMDSQHVVKYNTDMILMVRLNISLGVMIFEAKKSVQVEEVQ